MPSSPPAALGGSEVPPGGNIRNNFAPAFVPPGPSVWGGTRDGNGRYVLTFPSLFLIKSDPVHLAFLQSDSVHLTLFKSDSVQTSGCSSRIQSTPPPHCRQPLSSRIQSNSSSSALLFLTFCGPCGGVLLNGPGTPLSDQGGGFHLFALLLSSTRSALSPFCWKETTRDGEGEELDSARRAAGSAIVRLAAGVTVTRGW